MQSSGSIARSASYPQPEGAERVGAFVRKGSHTGVRCQDILYTIYHDILYKQATGNEETGPLRGRTGAQVDLTHSGGPVGHHQEVVQFIQAHPLLRQRLADEILRPCQ